MNSGGRIRSLHKLLKSGGKLDLHDITTPVGILIDLFSVFSRTGGSLPYQILEWVHSVPNMTRIYC